MIIELSTEIRAKSIWVSREQFVVDGDAAQITPALVAAAKVTRGELYRHFLNQLVRGGEAYIDATTRHGRGQLFRIDGLAAFGDEAVHEIEGSGSGASLKQGLAKSMNDDNDNEMPVKIVTSLMSAIFERTAVNVACDFAAESVMLVIRRMMCSVTGHPEAVT